LLRDPGDRKYKANMEPFTEKNNSSFGKAR